MFPQSISDFPIFIVKLETLKFSLRPRNTWLSPKKKTHIKYSIKFGWKKFARPFECVHVQVMFLNECKDFVSSEQIRADTLMDPLRLAPAGSAPRTRKLSSQLEFVSRKSRWEEGVLAVTQLCHCEKKWQTLPDTWAATHMTNTTDAAN